MPEKRLTMKKLAIDLKKLAAVKVAPPESIERRIEDLFIFDARMLDRDTRQELVRLVPGLTRIRRAWKTYFAVFGCVSCHRKKVPYGAGGLCDRCQQRALYRMRTYFRQIDAGRDTAGEIAALTRKLDTAQMLFNCGDDSKV